MPIVIISRGSMSRGEELARARRHDPEPSLPRARDRGGGGREDRSSPGRSPREAGNEPRALGSPTFERRMYVTAVQTALAEAAADGNLVYHGYAGHLLLRELPFALRVRLIAPLARRKLAVVERQGLPPDAAERYVRQVDDERARWTRFMYNVDLADPSSTTWWSISRPCHSGPPVRSCSRPWHSPSLPSLRRSGGGSMTSCWPAGQAGSGDASRLASPRPACRGDRRSRDARRRASEHAARSDERARGARGAGRRRGRSRCRLGGDPGRDRVVVRQGDPARARRRIARRAYFRSSSSSCIRLRTPSGLSPRAMAASFSSRS